MIIRVNRYWLLVLLIVAGLRATQAQTSLTLTYGNPSTSSDTAFDGNVFQAGTEIGDARFFAKFGGTGTRSFEIDSPGENVTKKVTSDGFVFIRPVASMVIDQSKIKGFTGPVSGSLVITVKPLSITTINTNVTTDVSPGSDIIVYYRTGSGTFPRELASKKFSVQLLTTNGVLVTDLLNATDQYSARELAGSSLGGIRSIKATLPTSTTSGSYQVRVSTQGLISGVVGSASSSFTVKASTPAVTAITANSIPGSYCAGSTVSFPFSTTGTFPTGNAFKVQLVNANGSILQDLPGTSLVSPISTTVPATLATGTYRFQIAATATNVVSNTSSLGVLTFPAMTISGSSTIATGETAPIRFDFTGTPPWSVTYTDNISTTSTRTITSSINSTTITPTFQSSTIYDKSFIKSFSDNVCGVSSQISGSAQITTISQLTITTGALSGSYCPGATLPVSFTVSGTVPAGVVYEVQLSDATGSFSAVQSLGAGGSSPISVPIPTTLASGTGYRVQVVIQKPTTSGSVDYSRFAGSVASSLIINRPDVPKVVDLSVCSGATTAPLSATGTNLKWYATSSVSQSLTSAPTPPNDRSSIYYVSQTVNGCESARQPISVSIVAAPSAPLVSSVTLCQGTPGQFTTSPNVLWYTAATGGTGVPQPPTINSQTAGELTAYISQTVVGCESPRVAVKATVYSIPTAPTTTQSSFTICQFSTPASLSATGSGLLWYGQSGLLTGAPTPGTSLAGTQSYSVTQTINGCESLRTSVTVVISTAPVAPSAGSPAYCVGTTPASLTATGTNLKWYTATTSGTASSTPPNISTQTATVFTVYVSQTDANGCESPRQPVSVSIIATPSAPTVGSVSICQGASGQFSASIPGAFWYMAATGGVGSALPPTLNNQTSGEQTVYVTQTINGCESPRAAVKAIVNPIPVAPTAAPTLLCQFSNPSSLSATGSFLTWYNQSGKLASAPVPGTSLAGTQSYSVTQTINGCESPRATVTVTVRSASSTPTVSSVRYCINDVPRSITTVISNAKWYQSSTGGTSSATSPPFLTETAQVYTFYVTQTDTSGCESLRQPVSVSVVAPPSAPTVTAAQFLCQFSKASPLTASPNTGLTWQGPNINGSTEVAPTPNTLAAGIFSYSVTQRAGTCISSVAQITVTVAQAPSPPGAQSSVAFCVGTQSSPLSATGSNLTWYTNKDLTGPASTQVIPNTSQASLTTYYVTQKDANNCESQSNSVEVRVSKRATATLSGDGYVFPGDSTAIRIRLTGDPTWTLKVDWLPKPITIDNSKDSLYVLWVHPTQTTTYKVTSLSTGCGLGDSGASYQIRVITPLSAQPTLEPLSVNAYPNPTTGDLSVNWSSPTRQTVTLQLINAIGTIVKQVTRQSTSTPQTEVFHLDTQPAGLYFLQLKTPTNGVLSRTIVKQ
ncbi:Ig-like domain-containing protein [Spirosoma agri]|uniref:T9SS type A sorting domain-containing protein n=1 Tax=Spirosoma agri TaxID=1987381 RepID=A0A6M0IHS8_9BACT|nr:T9SS type A sorting domain-containing protein [Spirosoma agri]NEU67402.1 T9SS type A sorting domain-containing protein [Spirosoma agri]